MRRSGGKESGLGHACGSLQGAGHSGSVRGWKAGVRPPGSRTRKWVWGRARRWPRLAPMASYRERTSLKPRSSGTTDVARGDVPARFCSG